MENLPDEGIDPLKILKDALIRWGKKAEKRPTFRLQKIGEGETLNLIKGLGSSTSMGRDGLDGPSIKMAAALLFKPLMFIINLSIEEKKFCNKWKLSKVLPLHKGKGKSKLSPQSYRPICILPVCSKLVEMVVKRQLVKYMEDSRQWNFNNQAYRENLNTTTTLLSLSDTIFQATEEKEIATAIAIDESAAFDCVSYEILENKMRLYNFDENTV